MKKIYTIGSLGLTAVILVIIGWPMIVQIVEAAALFNKSDTLSSVKVNTLANHTIIFRTPTGVDASTDTITLAFHLSSAAFNMGTFSANNFDFATSSSGQSTCSGVSFTEKSVAASAAADTWGIAQSGQTVTFTAPTNAGSGYMPANTCIRIEIGDNATNQVAGAKQITNSTTATSSPIGIAGVFGDTGTTTVEIISDDQVAVSGTVLESLTFSLSDNTIGFGTLSASAARFASGDTNGSATEAEAHNIIIGTNALSGYTTTVTSSPTTLTTSAGSTITAIGASNTASSAGTEQFGLRATVSGGSGTVSAPYAAAGFALDTAAFPDEVGAATGASANSTFSLRYLANITANTESGSYSATLTYVATGNF